MHDTALAIGTKFLEFYVTAAATLVVELGSYDVNGSLRAACPCGPTYLGLDVAHGPGVDLVVDPEQPLPLRAGLADLVLTSSQMEHDPFFWNTFLELVRILKPGGALYFSAPSNGSYHSYPVDTWRFFPDAGRSLVRWARSKGHDLRLVESFTAERRDDIWNDFVAVFRLESGDARESALLSDHFPCTNVWIGAAAEIARRSDLPEDMRIIRRLMAEADILRAKLRGAEVAIAEAAVEIADLKARYAAAAIQEPAQPGPFPALPDAGEAAASTGPDPDDVAVRPVAAMDPAASA